MTLREYLLSAQNLRQIALFPWVLLILLIAAPLPAADLPSISLDSGGWFVKRGFEQSYIEENFSPSEETQWIKKESVPVKPVDFETDKSLTNATYTLITAFRDAADLRSSIRPLGLYLPSIGEAWKIYLNGHLIADNYSLNEDGTVAVNRFIRGGLIGFSPSILKEENKLVIVVTGDPRYWGTGLHYAPGYKISDYSELADSKSELIIFMLMTLYLLVGGYHLLLYARRPKDRYNLFYGLFSAGIFIYFFTRTDLVFEIIQRSDIIMWMEYISLFLVMPLLISFFESLFFNKISIINKISAVFCGFLIVSVPFVPLSFSANVVLLIWQLGAFVIMIYFIYLMIKALISGNREAPYLAAGLVVVIGTATFDILDAIFFQTGIAFTKYGFFIFMMGIAVILANKFVNVYHEVEDLNVNLEQKVNDRTEALNRSLDEITALKYQQDGDYYLTSLLVNPLGRNDVVSENFSVKHLSRQYKHFNFKNKDLEIGGDLVIATSLRLHNRRYIAFLNCDAMGKSMQGAGGALIAGVVYHSFLTRSLTTENYSMRYPERWLKECFNDLKNVFLTFDGSMMISLVMGLIDEESGLMYYLNAEHPWTVLYRNRKASFIENELSHHKLGVEIEDTRLKIRTYQLLPGDIIIAGSDGRDDIVTGTDEHGSRIINEDESLFLRVAEEAGGDPVEMQRILMQRGELSDDLSLISVACRKISAAQLVPDDDSFEGIKRAVKTASEKYADGQSNDALSVLRTAREKYGNNSLLLKEIVKFYLKDRKYKAAADMAEQYSTVCPEDSELLYMTSYASKFSGDIDRGIDYGERLRLRDPGNHRNLFNLAELYARTENIAKSVRIIEEALQAGGSPETAAGLKRMIKESVSGE
jgi:hypothetical protein